MTITIYNWIASIGLCIGVILASVITYKKIKKNSEYSYTILMEIKQVLIVMCIISLGPIISLFLIVMCIISLGPIISLLFNVR